MGISLLSFPFTSSNHYYCHLRPYHATPVTSNTGMFFSPHSHHTRGAMETLHAGTYLHRSLGSTPGTTRDCGSRQYPERSEGGFKTKDFRKGSLENSQKCHNKDVMAQLKNQP